MSGNSRRKFIAAAVTAGAAGIAGGTWWWRGMHDRHAGHDTHAGHAKTPDVAFPNALRVPGTSGVMGILDATAPLVMTAKPARLALLPGKPAAVLAYEIEHQGASFINPTLRMKTGTAVQVEFRNALDEPSIIHWHGLKVDSDNDGLPHHAISGGATYGYRYTVSNRAATYWYHPHPHGLTGKQAYLGLAGLLLVEDEDELALQQALDLRLGATDIPLVIQDRRFDDAGNPVYAPTDTEWFHGYLGDQVLINSTARPHFNAASRLYRFRILNGSNARVYRLAFDHGGHLLRYQVIGTDGGLLERPHAVQEVFLSPAERVDVLLDLRDLRAGDT
ncbi:MAG: multicopper oxidase domain-containing protein, partial [Burkholderiales bacterium]|nr:multicopper oxidase domain-containing protein [Burkholderiales bacterium]